MSNDTIRVVGCTADKKQVTLYIEDGSKLVINQGDHRLKDLLDAIIPITTKGEVAIISLNDYSVYSAFQRRSENEGSVTRFFRVAKKALTKVFGTEEEKEVYRLSESTVNTLQRRLDGTPEPAPEPKEEGTSYNDSSKPEPVPTPEEVLKEDFKPIGSDDNHEEDETIVAVLPNGVVIPGIEKIKPLIDRAVKTNSIVSVQAFLTRIAAYIDKRQHSVEDLMRFLEKADLPLAEDGSIIAYKRLKRHSSGTGYIDCHTGKVHQFIGSYVCVDEKLVDLNRRNACSNGLHIARRGYLSGFSGNVTVLCKIAPEDVMVVPHNDANKVRVMGYHILAEIDDSAVERLDANKPMTECNEATTLVWNAIMGNHVGRLTEVKVHGQMGNDVRLTQLVPESEIKYQTSLTPAQRAQAAALDDSRNTGISPTEINKRVAEELNNRTEKLTESDIEPELDDEVVNSLEEEINNLSDEDLKAINDIHDNIVDNLASKSNQDKAEEKAQAKEDTQREAKRQRDRDRRARQKAEKEASKSAAEKVQKKPVKAPAKATKANQKKQTKAGTKKEKSKPSDSNKPLTKAEEARKHYENGDYKLLNYLKRTSKKSWAALGFTEAEIEKINPEVG